MVTKRKQAPDGQVTTSAGARERLKLNETGYLGLNIVAGVSQEELKRDLNWPSSIKIYKQMTYSPAVNSALTLYDNIVGKVKWKYSAPESATEQEKQQAVYINQMMHDMEGQTWREFISDAMSIMVYGFSVHEKVYRRRLESKGSKFNDGIIGWKKLAIRNQETIEKFEFSKNGSDIVEVTQSLGLVSDPYGRFSSRVGKSITLDRGEFMLFRTGKHKGSPFGVSPLRDAYSSWKFLTAIEELEAIGFSKDLGGIPVLKIPPQYMSSDASPDQKAIYAYYQNVIRNLQQNQQSGIILPQAFDSETKQSLFSLELLSNGGGGKNFDSDKIKDYYKKAILTTLFADILILGQAGSGSFALGVVKNSLTGTAVEAVLNKIADVLTGDLLVQTFKYNGWDTARIGKFEFDGIENRDLEVVSKAYQRYASTGLLELDRELLNGVRISLGINPLPDDMEPRSALLTGNTSRASDGMATAGEGTSSAISGRDTSSDNLDNTG